MKKKTKRKRRPTIKQFGDLRAADFAMNPVWASVYSFDYGKPWYNKCDEESFRPWTKALPVKPLDGMFLIAAEFTMADGSKHSGFLTPQDKREPFDLGSMQPQVFAVSGKTCSFWKGMMKPKKSDIRGIYKSFGKSAKEVFPIEFNATRGLAKGRVAGSIPGFCWMSFGKTDRVLSIQ